MSVKALQDRITEGQASITHPDDQKNMTVFLEKLKEYRTSILAYSRELALRRTGEGIRSWEASLVETETLAHQLIRGIKKRLRQEIEANDLLLLEESAASRQVSLLLGCGGVIAALLIGIWLRIAMARPITRLVGVCERVADGDLQPEIKRFDNDEIGTLAKSVQSIIESLRTVVGEIKISADEIGGASIELGHNVREIESGAALQGSEVGKVASAVNKMDAIITDLNGKVNRLMVSLDESSSSGQRMSSAIWQSSQLADGLANEVESISSAQLQMNRSIAESVTFFEDLLETSKNMATIAEDLAASSEQVGSVAQDSKTLTENVTEIAKGKGAVSLAKTIEVTKENKQLVDDYSRLISSLEQHSSGIGNVTSVVSNVADQISLLSLNAAIIAAQAGDHGRGFAVVAQEIRSLSEETTSSIAEIDEGIKGVQQVVQSAVKLIEQVMQGSDTCIESALQANEILQEIVDSSENSSDIACQIATSAQQQLEHSQEIRQQTAETANQVLQSKIMLAEQKSGSDNIVKSVEELRDIFDQLKQGAKEQAEQAEVISEALQATHEFSLQIGQAMDEEQQASKDIVVAMEKIATVASNNEQVVHKLSERVNGLGALSKNLTPKVDKFKLPQAAVSPTNGGDVESE